VSVDGPRDGKEAAFLALFRRLPPHEQRAFEDSLRRQVEDGLPLETAMEEFAIECGTPPGEAREFVRQALASPADPARWRRWLI
jgi:hypothetical protein